MQVDANLLSCTTCDAGSYLHYQNKTHFMCKKCPQNMTTFENTNAADVYDCLCAAGFYDPVNADKCTPCAAGYYKDSAGNQSCLACPLNSFSVSKASTNISACLCEQGFFSTDASCEQCSAGSYKATISNISCSQCPVHHYCPIGSIQPIPCFNDSQSFSSAESYVDCMCNTGYQSQFSWASALYDTSCGPRPYLCDDILAEDGECPTGFCLLEDGVSCTVDYVTGQTTTASIDGVCRTDLMKQCDYNPTDLQFYSTSEMQPLFRAHPDIHTAAYWTDVNNVVSQSNKRGQQCINECAANPLCDYAVVQDYGQSHYWTTYATDCWHVFCNGDVLNCISPRLNGHWVTYAKVADLCVDIDVTDEKCNTTLCSVGDKWCVGCEPGTYNNAIDSTTCADCPHDTYNDKYGAQLLQNCSKCDDNAASDLQSISVTNCSCNLGYSGSPGEACIVCSKGTFRNSSYSYICDNCPRNTFNDVLGANSSAACIACPGNTSSQQQSTTIEACVCNAGYYASTAIYDCHACQAGKYQTFTNTTSCVGCEAGKYSSTTAANSDSVCLQCAHGLYSTVTAMTACLQCDANTWQDKNDARDTECRACIGNSSTLGQKGSKSLYNCVCDPGFAPRLNGTLQYHCVQCPAGSYCPGNNIELPCSTNTFSFTGQTSCTTCHINSFAWQPQNIDSTACLCKPGYEGSYGDNCTACAPGKYQAVNFSAGDMANNIPDKIECQACAVGYYQAQPAGTACVTCPQHATSDLQAASLEYCYCLPGFFGTAETCRLCPEGFYCAGGEFKEACRPFSNSANGSKTEADCKCVGGFYSSADATPCLICPANTYCVGNRNITQCANQSQSRAGSDSIDDCKCRYGFWRGCIRTSDGHYLDVNSNACTIQYHSACTACPENTVCANETVVHCPDHSLSERGAGNADECVCEDGYYKHTKHSDEEHAHTVDDGHLTMPTV